MVPFESAANVLIACSLESGRLYDRVSLIRAVIYAHGLRLARYGEPLLSEAVEAGNLGVEISRAIAPGGMSPVNWSGKVTGMLFAPMGAGCTLPCVPARAQKLLRKLHCRIEQSSFEAFSREVGRAYSSVPVTDSKVYANRDIRMLFGEKGAWV